MAKHLSFLDIELDDPVECPCGWQGKISDNLEPYEEVADVCCSTCGVMLLVIAYPTVEEVKSAAAAGNPVAQRNLGFYLEFERKQQRFEKLKLAAAEQLPQLDGERLEFAWDFEGVELKTDLWTVIRLGEHEVWREPAVFEGCERFNAVKTIFKERYGARFASLTPTRASEMYLYGDRGRKVSTT